VTFCVTASIIAIGHTFPLAGDGFRNGNTTRRCSLKGMAYRCLDYRWQAWRVLFHFCNPSCAVPLL